MEPFWRTPLPELVAARADIERLFEALSREGFRVIGIAWREVPADHPHAVVTDETELVFAGFTASLDPPKASGVAVKIVTGDNELVTRHGGHRHGRRQHRCGAGNRRRGH